MALEILDSEENTATVHRVVIDGYAGGSDEQLFYIRNNDASRWYTNITLSLNTGGDVGYVGYSYKFLAGQRRPTEAEWSEIQTNADLELDDIGDESAADITTNWPVWVRVYVPGGTSAIVKDTYTLELSYYPRIVTG